MSSGDIQNGDKSEFHQVKLIDGFSFMSMGNMFIKDDDGKELEVKYMPGCSLHDKYVNFGDIGTSSMYFQLLDVPACVLAITSIEQIVDKLKDHLKLKPISVHGDH